LVVLIGEKIQNQAGTKMESTTNWQRCNMQTFWREVAPCSHVVQIYEEEDVFLNLLEGYIAGGITVGDCVIVIATAAHLHTLEARLRSHGLDLATLAARDQYIPLDAEAVLSQILVNDWPDYQRFMETMDALFDRAHRAQRQVRAFGEVVSLLWSQGKSGATVMLEYLWNTLYEREQFALFCAYPRNGFAQDTHSAVKNICSTHATMITGWEKSKTEMCYRHVA
jgi:hypothetical protein